MEAEQKATIQTFKENNFIFRGKSARNKRIYSRSINVLKYYGNYNYLHFI